MDGRNFLPDIRDASRALKCVYIYKMFHDNGRLDIYESNAPPYMDEEMVYDATYIGLAYLSDAVWSHYSEDEEKETMYFSHPDIMEYYRLCRVYGKKFKVTLRENPFMRTAASYVRDQLAQGCYACDYHLQTKINHKWASGIVFRMWPEFAWHYELLILINRIFCFYTAELKKLKQELGITCENNNLKEAA